MNAPLAIGVVPSFWKSRPLVMVVILKTVTSPPSAAFRVMTSPDDDCTFASVVALVTDGVSAIGFTVIVAVAVPPPRPASTLLSEACAVKLPVPKKSAAVVNFSPAFPSAKVMKSLFAIGVVPSVWNSVPFVIPVILKWVTSVPSAAFRPITRPLVVCVSSLVVALVTDGVSATGVTVSRNVSLMLTGVPPIVLVAVTVIVVVPNWFSAGVSVKVRVDGVSAPTTAFAGGTSVVLLDVAVMDVKALVLSPTWNVNDSGVSSGIVLSVMASSDGSASNAPMSTVAVVSTSAASRIRPKPGPR